MLQADIKIIIKITSDKSVDYEDWLRSYILRQKLKYFVNLKRHDGMGLIIFGDRVNGKENEEGLGDSGRRA